MLTSSSSLASRMKNGLRVVRVMNMKDIKRKFRSWGLEPPRKSKRSSQTDVKPVVAAPSTNEEMPDEPIAGSPKVETNSPKRVVASPEVEPIPAPLVTSSPTVHTPFRNPYLNDQPLHWSPRMFKPEIDRQNWTWSDWDSPSREIEDVTYQTDTWPIRDPFARYPPELRKRLQAIMAMKPKDTPPATHSTDSTPPDTIRYEEVNFLSSFDSSSAKSVRSRSSDSSWVILNDRPWPPHLLEMLLDAEEQDKRLAAKGFFDREWEKSTIHSASNLDASHHSQSQGFSSLLQLYVDADNDRQRFAESRKIDSRPSSSESLSAHSASEEAEAKALDATGVSAPSSSSSDVSGHSRSSEFSSYVDVDEKKWSDQTFDLLNMIDESRRERAQEDARMAAGVSLFASESDASDLSQPSEFSRWVKFDVPKWSDDTFEIYTEIEEARRRGPEPTSTLSASCLDASLPVNSDVNFAAHQHFHSLQGSPSSSVKAPSIPATSQPIQVDHDTAPVQQFPPSWSTGSSRHFHTMRQLPSAIATEPQQSSEEPSRGSGFGWKSIACVAAAAAAVGAGLAYWFSG
ncbi:hypothetical protein F5Y13DRAFT_185499 [Hypoxylon sp. FL1857]|nr:hypothetical protein F5Y13DRAFT_185499 [Hypoxylon sp. FL1857]